jgi:predicted transcriptional regulator
MTFRLDTETKGRLEKLAERTGVKPGELVRDIVKEKIDTGQEIDRLRLKVSAVEGELSELRKDLSVAVQAILCASGRVTPEQAQEWVRLNMKKV